MPPTNPAVSGLVVTTDPHRLNRSQMVQIIQNKESVLVNGKIISAVEHLPSELEIAAGNPEATEDAIDAIKAEMERLGKLLDQAIAGEIKPPARTGPDPWPAPPQPETREQLLAKLAALDAANPPAQAAPAPAPQPAPAQEQPAPAQPDAAAQNPPADATKPAKGGK